MDLYQVLLRFALIFGMYMKHHLVDLHQVCLNDGAQIGSTPGVTRDMDSFQQISMLPLNKLRWSI